MEHDNGLALPFIPVVVAEAVQGDEAVGEGIEFLHEEEFNRRARRETHRKKCTFSLPHNLTTCFYHSSPSIKQDKPLPMPRKLTRSPGRRNSRSSAKAAVR